MYDYYLSGNACCRVLSNGPGTAPLPLLAPGDGHGRDLSGRMRRRRCDAERAAMTSGGTAGQGVQAGGHAVAAKLLNPLVQLPRLRGSAEDGRCELCPYESYPG